VRVISLDKVKLGLLPVHILQIVARKVIRMSRQTTIKDIENEALTIDKLNRRAFDRKNIVEILGHGWLIPYKTHPQSAVYFLDMEYCSMNLSQYIPRAKEDAASLKSLTYMPFAFHPEK